MNCQDVQNLLPVFLDNELPEDQKQDIQVHLTGCNACRLELQEYKRSWQMLESWTDVEPEAGYIGRFWAELSGRTPWPIKVRIWFGQRVFTPQLIAATVVAVVFVVVGFLSVRNYVQIQETEILLTKLPAEEAEVVDNLEFVSDYELLEDLDVLEDMEVLETLEEIES